MIKLATGIVLPAKREQEQEQEGRGGQLKSVWIA